MTKPTKFLAYTMLILCALVSVFPIAWMFISSTNTSADILSARLLPGSNFSANLATLFAGHDVGRAMFNSLRNSVVHTAVSLLVTSIAGYGFEVYHDKLKDRLMAVLLLAMMVPMTSIMIPLFKMFSGMKLLNTMVACILPTLSTPFFIMFFRSAARSFPHELIDAARMDGLSELQIFLRIYMPSMKSTYGAAMTVIFMNSWNNYLWPRIALITNDSLTMPLLISSLNANNLIDYGELMLATSISTVPTIIIFLFLQKSFQNGLVGSVKG